MHQRRSRTLRKMGVFKGGEGAANALCLPALGGGLRVVERGDAIANHARSDVVTIGNFGD